MKTFYRVWAERGEARTKANERWTEEEVLADYNSQTCYEPHTLQEFNTKQEALDYYNWLEPMKTHKLATNLGYVLVYEVIGVDKVGTVEGEEIEWEQLAIKTMEYKKGE